MHDRFVRWGIPSWFWICLGVILLVLTTMFTVIRLMPLGGEAAALPPPAPAFSLPPGAAGPQVPVSLLPTTSTVASAPPSSSVPAPSPSGTRGYEITVPDAPRTTTPPAALISGRYQVLTSYSDSFIAQVLLTNGTAQPQSWRAILVFPGNVGELVTSWVESLPQPALKQSGHTFTWTSSAPLAARSTGQLRFHFKRTGSGDTPTSCSANDAACR
jgi:hypothetical protein